MIQQRLLKIIRRNRVLTICGQNLKKKNMEEFFSKAECYNHVHNILRLLDG